MVSHASARVAESRRVCHPLVMKTHRSLDAWQESRSVVLLAIAAARQHWKPWAAALFGQLLRASLSVQLNIAEGASFGRSPTYTRHLGIAYGSAVEVGEILEVMRPNNRNGSS